MRTRSLFRIAQFAFSLFCFLHASTASDDVDEVEDDINKSDEDLYTMVTKPGVFKYIAFISSQAGICTGTIINESWVLTAASCCYFRNKQVNDRDLHILAGLADYEFYEDTIMQKTFSVKIHVHPKYWEGRPGKFVVALVKLRDPFEFNEYIGKIAVSSEGWPQTRQDPKDDLAQNCMSLGFGGYHSTTPPTTNLKMWNVTALHSETACPCLKRFQWKRLVCVKEATHPLTCSGDTGGPLICNNSVVAISHMVLNRASCSSSDTKAPTLKCVNNHENGLTMYFFLCVVNDWMHGIVPEIPKQPESCVGVNVIYSLTLIVIRLLTVA